MNTQAMIEVVLDRWVTSAELRFIRENYRAFYNDPMGHKHLASIICDELGSDIDAWELCVNVY